MITSITKVIVPTKELDKNNKPKFTLVGYRLDLEGGGSAFYCRRTGTISLTMPPTPIYYRSGTMMTNNVGVPVMNKPSKVSGIKLEKMHKHFGTKFTQSILEALAQV